MERPRLGSAVGWGALVGLLLTAPMTALLGLADRLAGLPFVPFDFFDWTTRVLPGPWVTFGIDAMIGTLEAVGLDVADTAKTAERASAILLFLVLGAVAGAAFFAFFKWRRRGPDIVAGLVVGALVGPPLTAISLAIGARSGAFCWRSHGSRRRGSVSRSRKLPGSSGAGTGRSSPASTPSRSAAPRATARPRSLSPAATGRAARRVSTARRSMLDARARGPRLSSPAARAPGSAPAPAAPRSRRRPPASDRSPSVAARPRRPPRTSPAAARPRRGSRAWPPS